jgi:hypothetical protein
MYFKHIQTGSKIYIHMLNNIHTYDPYGKYKHESCFIKIGLYSTYAKRKFTLY